MTAQIASRAVSKKRGSLSTRPALLLLAHALACLLLGAFAVQAQVLDGNRNLNRVRELLEVGTSLDDGKDNVTSETFFFGAQPRCQDNCADCDGYGQCITCKEGYVPIRSSTGLACSCMDSDCSSCPEDPAVCTSCKDFMAEPDESGVCACKEGYFLSEEDGTCQEDQMISVRPGLNQPAPEPSPVPEPVSSTPVPVPESVPPEPDPEPTLDNSTPDVPPRDRICLDPLCSFCPLSVEFCDGCVENAFLNDLDVCVCNDGFKMDQDEADMFACVEDTNDEDADISVRPPAPNDEGAGISIRPPAPNDEGAGIGVRPPAPTTPPSQTTSQNGISVAPNNGAGGSSSLSASSENVVTSTLQEKIQDLANKHGIQLSDKVQSLLDKKEDISVALSEMLAEKGDAAVELHDKLAELVAAASTNQSIRADGFQYSNIRLESVTPESFTQAAENQVGLLSTDRTASNANAEASGRMKDWIKNKLKRDDKPSFDLQQPASYGQQSYVSGFDGSVQPTMTTTKNPNQDLIDKKSMLLELLKETDQAEIDALQRSTKEIDDHTATLLAMLAATNEEIERRAQ